MGQKVNDFQESMSFAAFKLILNSSRSHVTTSFHVSLGSPLAKLQPTSNYLHLLDHETSSIFLDTQGMVIIYGSIFIIFNPSLFPRSTGEIDVLWSNITYLSNCFCVVSFYSNHIIFSNWLDRTSI